MKVTVLVTGGNGQLARCLNAISPQYPTLNFIFVDRNTLDITEANNVADFFKEHTIDWCINCAAYTAVDKAEEEFEIAEKVNVGGAKNLAQACKEYGTKLIHISTDFVFDGEQNIAYTELDATDPINIYGQTKLHGEVEVKRYCPTSFIIRTSWLYSEFGNNFMKTMLRLASEREQLTVVNDQMGSPTYAVDLAKVLLHIILENKTNYGVFHYSNQGQITWFEFASTIFKLANKTITVSPVCTQDYVTLAKRPKFSVMDTSKISKEFELQIPFWKDSLTQALSKVVN